MRYRFSLILPFLLITAAFAQSDPAAPAANGKLQIHHIDVGQGDGGVMITPKGTVVLFDAGADTARKKNCSNEVDYLDQIGVRQVDLVFISHYHSDHIGCIPAVLQKFPLTGDVYDRGDEYKSAQYNNYVKAVGTHRKTAVVGKTITLDGGAHPVTLKVLAVNGGYAAGSVNAKNENDVSLSVLVSFDGFREEIGGDLSGEKTGIYVDVESGTAPSVGTLDVYKVHHHCSSHSSNDNWMAATRPTVAVISDGDGNDYGHPTADCLGRLHEAEVSEVYWTEKGAGTPGPKDLVSGDVIIEVPAQSQTFTVMHNDGATDTYRIKAGSGVRNELALVSATAGALDTQPHYAWSTKSRYYQEITCPAVARISKANLNTGVVPPPDKEPSECAKERAPQAPQ